MNAILNQLNAWRNRWRPKPTEESIDNTDKYFAEAFTTVQGKEVIDYLISNYYKPIEFVGASDPGRLAERNGQQILMVDILTRIDRGLHPMAHQDSPSTEVPFDARV